MSIITNYSNILKNINETAKTCNRDPKTITLLPVSKTFPAEAMIELINEGIEIFGENKVQEAKIKKQILEKKCSLHLIGHLQSNKVRDAVGLFDMIHSIDKFSTAKDVDKEAGKISKIQKILVEVNTSGEGSKFGVNPDNAEDLCKEILTLENIKLQGLMTIGPLTDDRDQIRKSFRLLNEIKNIIAKTAPDFNILSMGMSSDYDIAIEEGATIIRVGSAIFGKRDYG